MNKIKIIRQFSTLALLLLFILSNTPKQLLHDLFANHADAAMRKAGASDIATIKTLSFHCQCDHLVVESPFTESTSPASVYFPFNYGQFISSSYGFIIAGHEFQLNLRGPPLS